jgi:choline/glycine/proline betaine transport protein
VLDRYETHLSFLDYSSEHAYDSVLTPPPAQPMTGPVRTVEESGEDVEAVRPSLRAARRPVEDAKPSSGSGSSPVQGTDEGRDIG